MNKKNQRIVNLKILYISSKRRKEKELLEAAKMEYFEINFHLRSILGKTLLNNILLAIKIAKKWKPDVILVENVGLLTLMGVYLKKRYKIPLAIRIKGDLWQEYAELKYNLPIIEKLAKIANAVAGIFSLKFADSLLCISHHLKKTTEKKIEKWPKKPKVFIVHIPYSENQMQNFVHNTFNFKGRYTAYFLSVTNFYFKNKNRALIEAIFQLSEFIIKNKICWLIAGDGFFFEWFQEQVKKYIDSKNIKLLGHVKNIEFLYKNATLFLHFSNMDGLPNVLLEASLFKLPILMNKGCPAEEFIINGYNGFLINLKNKKETITILDQLVSSPSLRRIIGGNSYNFVKNNFCIEKVSNQLKRALMFTLCEK